MKGRGTRTVRGNKKHVLFVGANKGRSCTPDVPDWVVCGWFGMMVWHYAAQVSRVSSMLLNYRLVACPSVIPINGSVGLEGFGGRVCMGKDPPALPFDVPVEVVSALVLRKVTEDAAARLRLPQNQVSLDFPSLRLTWRHSAS